MKEKLDFYESIRREYPEVITKDQFYRIAHISKATALFLLQSGKVPYKDSGKKHVGNLVPHASLRASQPLYCLG